MRSKISSKSSLDPLIMQHSYYLSNLVLTALIACDIGNSFSVPPAKKITRDKLLLSLIPENLPSREKLALLVNLLSETRGKLGRVRRAQMSVSLTRITGRHACL
jgi:hypothetical protein